MMNVEDELRSERNALDRADLDIEDGERRIRNQQDILAKLQATGHSTREAERLSALLRHTLEQWQQHRVLILQRIAYLESKSTEAVKFKPG